MRLILFSFEASMREVIDNTIKPSIFQVSVELHCFHVNAMQNCGPQSFQIHYIRLCSGVLIPHSLCRKGLRNAEENRLV